MQIQTQRVANELVQLIWHNFNEELKVKKLIKQIPKYNETYVSRMAGASTGTAYLQNPPLRNFLAFNQLSQDQFPSNIPIDQNANYLIKSVTANIEGPIFRDKQMQKNSKQTSRYRKTGSTFRASMNLGRKGQKQEGGKEDLSKYFVIPPNNNNQTIQLTSPPLSQQQIDLEFELRAMQKKLYFMRKTKQQQQLKQQERIKALKRRKSPQLPKTDFTYETNGNFIKRKPFRSDSLIVQQMKISQSFDLKPKDKKSLNQLLQQSDPNRGRSQLSSRYQKASVFNNSNKRQVSHLPFIKLCDNSRIKQENRNGQGNKTERISLRSFGQSLEQKSFKHFSQIQRQKKQKQLLAKLQMRKEQNLKQQVDKNPQQPQDDGYNNMIRRRQSYLLSKYLKKVKQQNSQQTRKSFNFGRVSFPKASPIHAYYKHNFNQERKFYQSEVISRVLDNSNQEQK